MQKNWPNEDSAFQEASWVWTTEEWDNIIEDLTNIRTPTCYGSSLRYKFSDRKLVGFKMHNYHNLLLDILPIVVRGSLTANIRDIVYRLGKYPSAANLSFTWYYKRLTT
jgi:hypothetical protein